jgi:hypothetical protein
VPSYICFVICDRSRGELLHFSALLEYKLLCQLIRLQASSNHFYLKRYGWSLLAGELFNFDRSQCEHLQFLFKAFGHSVPSYIYYGQEKTPTELTIGVLGVKA